MTPQQNNRVQRKQKAESGNRIFKTSETEKRMKPAVERRRSAPTMAISKALSKSRTPSRDGPISPTSPDSKSLVQAFSSPTTAFIMDERVQLTTGLQTQERHLFLFSDVLVITKSKSSTNLKLKNQVRLCEMWTAFCIDEVCERKTTPEYSFVIGWPTTNCVITFSSAEAKEKWLSALQWQIKEMKRDEHPKKISMKMLVMTTQSGASALTLMVGNTDTARKVIKMAAQQLNAKDRATNHQLWVISGKEATPYPLIGHEQPFSVIMNCLRDFTAHMERSDTNVQSRSDKRSILFEDLPKAKQCQFILKPRPQPGIPVTRETTPKTLKKRKSLIDWALRRSSSNQSDSSLTSESPITPRKLFGLSLPSICKNGILPKPIMDMLVLLYHEGPSTKGIFRRSANAKTCKELKEKLNSGNEDFLRNIPGSVLSSELYEKWMEGIENENEEEKIQFMKNLVEELPEANALLLRHLFGVLHHIEKNSEENQMTAFNLALCIAPNMLWLPSPMGPEEESKCTRKVAILVQFMIENTYRIFGSGLNSLFGRSGDVQRGNSEDSLDVDLLQPQYSSDDMDSALSDQKRQEVEKDQKSNSIFITLNDSRVYATEEAKDIWNQQSFFNEEASCKKFLEKIDSGDLCEQLENESLYSCSSVSSLAAIQSIDSARDRCSSEPSVCLSHHLALSHEPVARQSSCDAAITHGHIDHLQQLKKLQIESQKLLDDGKGPGSNKTRYTFWRSPQSNTRLKQPNPHKINLSTRSSLSSLSSPTTSPSESSLSSIDSAFSCSDSSVFGRSDTLHFGNSGKCQTPSPCISNRLPGKLPGTSSSSVACCLDDLDWYNEEAEKEEDLDCESEREDSTQISMEHMSCSKNLRSVDAEGSEKDFDLFTSVAYIRHDELGTNCVQNDAEELNRESYQERRNKLTVPHTTQFVTLPEESTVMPSYSKNFKRTKITFYMAPGKVLTIQQMGDQERQNPEVNNVAQDNNSHYSVLPPSKGSTRRLGQTLKVHIPQTVFYGQNSPLVLQSVARRQISDGSEASEQKLIPGDNLVRTSSRDSPSQNSKQLLDGSIQPASPQQCSNNTSNKRHTIHFILPPSVKTTVKDYFLHNEVKHCLRDTTTVENELIRRRQEWQSRRCTDSQLEDFEKIIFTDESYV
ncbi:rho GTPase-activating protein 20 isoform X2 [Heterodontus francisci]|uniref:rho GTPase-activating protein 20 isoform X2 n=1 Tax=Heterodontus francisci TaxID=7792 RepID=UPI00355BD00A